MTPDPATQPQQPAPFQIPPALASLVPLRGPLGALLLMGGILGSFHLSKALDTVAMVENMVLGAGILLTICVVLLVTIPLDMAARAMERDEQA